jgi:TRAP transporter TAXI family solute receptor
MIIAVVFLAGALLGVQPATAKLKYVTIGTGGVTGVYYPTGGAISRMVNKKRKQYGIRATVESTGGSVVNVNGVMSGDLEFGIVQSDRQYQAWHGLAEWKGQGPQKDLRAICSIHPESLNLVAAVDSGIKTIQDLKGKRVNIGNPGSGQRQNSIDALTNAGLNWEKDLIAEQVKAAEAPGLLQDGRIDAFFYTVGHPSGSIKEATTSCDSVMVEVAGPKIDKLVNNNDYYRTATIPGGMYRGTAADTKTFGVGATFVSSAKVPENVIYNVVKAVFDNFDQFKKLHPAFKNLKESEMIKDGLSAPLHDGAKKYYKERGWM